MLLLQNKNQKQKTMIFQLIEIRLNMMSFTFAFCFEAANFPTSE